MNINEVHWNFSDNGTQEPAKSRFWNFYNFWTAWNFLMRFSLLCSGEWALSFYLCVFIYTGVSLNIYSVRCCKAFDWFESCLVFMNGYKILKCFRKEKRASGELPCPATGLITFIVSSKFHNLLLLEGKWFISYYLTRHVLLFIQKHARQCSVLSVIAVLYFTKCGMVWCGAYI